MEDGWEYFGICMRKIQCCCLYCGTCMESMEYIQRSREYSRTYQSTTAIPYHQTTKSQTRYLAYKYHSSRLVCMKKKRRRRGGRKKGVDYAVQHCIQHSTTYHTTNSSVHTYHTVSTTIPKCKRRVSFFPFPSLVSSVCRDAFLEQGERRTVLHNLHQQYLVGGSGVQKPTYESTKTRHRQDMGRLWVSAGRCSRRKRMSEEQVMGWGFILEYCTHCTRARAYSDGNTDTNRLLRYIQDEKEWGLQWQCILKRCSN